MNQRQRKVIEGSRLASVGDSCTAFTREVADTLREIWIAGEQVGTCDVCKQRHQLIQQVTDPLGHKTACLPCFVFTRGLDLPR